MQRIEIQEDDTRIVAEERTPTQRDEDLSPSNANLVDLRAAAPVITIEPPAIADRVLQPVLAPAALADPPPQQAIGVPAIGVLNVLAGAKPVSDAHVEQKGDRITTIAFDSTALFGRASATLNSSGKVILQEVIGNLKSEDYRDYMVTIEGHTDDAPINTVQFPSNWELSTARAAAVVRFFVEQGVSAQRLRAAGYADTRPLQPNRDDAGIEMPDNQTKNRRVVIVLEKVEHR
jgi:flagellar motor protein MotB